MKEPGHYKANYRCIDKKHTASVKFEVAEVREQIIEKLKLKERSRDIKCCNRILRTLET